MELKDFDMPGKALLPEDYEKTIYNRIVGDIEDSDSFAIPKLERALRNVDFYAGRQWTPREEKAHLDQMRIPYVFNEIQRVVDSLIGTQTQTRMDSKIIPRERGDESPAELLTFLVKWTEQINNLESLETEVFKDALIKCYGAAVVRWEYKDVEYGYVKVEKIPVNELRWDPYSSKMDLSDARWMARIMEITKLDAIEMMPEYAEEIEKASTVSGTIGGINAVSTFKQSRVGRSLANSMDERREPVRLIEYYEKMTSYRYVVADAIRGEVNTFLDKKEAEYFYNGVVDGYVEAEENLLLPDGSDAVVIRTDAVDTFIQTLVLGEEVLFSKPISIPNYPWVLCFSYFDDGDFWSFVDNLIDPQILTNRSFSQLDYQLGTAGKNVLTVIEPALKKGFTIESLRREISKTSPVIPVVNHDALRPIPNQPVNPEYFQNIMFAIQRINDYGGGKNVMGLQESAAESGRAVIARSEQAGVGRLPFFDNLRLWRRQITERAVWYIKNYMSPGQIVRVIGSDQDVSFLNLDDSVLETISEISYDIIIDEAIKSASVRERQYAQLKDLFAVIQAPAEVVTPILLEYSDIPMSKKKEILQYLSFYQEYIQQKAQVMKQQEQQQSVMDSLQKQTLRDMLVQGKEMEAQGQEIQKQQDTLRIKLNDLENMRNQIQSGQNTPGSINAMNEKLRTPEEIQQGISSRLYGQMGVGY